MGQWRNNSAKTLPRVNANVQILEGKWDGESDTHIFLTQKHTTVHYTYKTACNLLLKGHHNYLYIGIKPFS